MHRVPDERAGHVAPLDAGLERPQPEVGVLAPRVREALVEAAEPFEQLPWVRDVAGLEPLARPDDPDAAREPVEVLGLGGVRLGPSLEDGAVVVPGTEQALEPVGGRPAIVVEERDQASGCRPPAGVALGRRPRRLRPLEEPNGQPVRGVGERARCRRADDDDLEPVS